MCVARQEHLTPEPRLSDQFRGGGAGPSHPRQSSQGGRYRSSRSSALVHEQHSLLGTTRAESVDNRATLNPLSTLAISVGWRWHDQRTATTVAPQGSACLSPETSRRSRQDDAGTSRPFAGRSRAAHSSLVSRPAGSSAPSPGSCPRGWRSISRRTASTSGSKHRASLRHARGRRCA